MLPTNMSQIGPLVVEKKSFEWFIQYMGMAASLNLNHDFFR